MTDELKKAEMAAHAYDGLGTCMSGVDRPQAHASPPFALRSSATLKGIETMSYTREDWKAAKQALDAIEAEREKLLSPTAFGYTAAQEELAAIEEQIGSNLGYCEGCSEPIFEGEAYHSGEGVSLCVACAPSYADMLAHPEHFRGENDDPMTVAEATALFEAHIAAGGSAEDKMAHQ